MSIKKRVAASLIAGVTMAALTGVAAPATAAMTAEQQRMARFNVSPHDVATVGAVMPRVAGYLNEVWTVATRQAGVAYAPPRVLAYTQAFEHPVCGPVAVNNAGYCPGSNQVLYDPIFLAALAKHVGGGDLGDGWYAIVVVVAHEWGHAIVAQTQGGTFRSRRAHEFAADCLAGAVTRHALAGRDIEHRHVDTAYRTLTVLGDPAGGAGVHGTSLERQRAFQFGFDNGAGRCMTVTASR
jgi:predicted metalloprotease